MWRNHASLKEAMRIIAPLVILAIGVGGFMALKGRRQVPVRPSAAKDPPLVKTARVGTYTDTLTIEVDGHVVPYLEVALSAEVAGRIIHKAEGCRAGKFVRQGALLLEIDPRDYRLATKQLTEELVQADVTLNELTVEVANTKSLIELANEDLELQRNDLDRHLKLESRRATTATAIDAAKSSVLGARNALLTLRNQLRLLATRRTRLQSAKNVISSRLERAELDLVRTTVTSPIDGMVVVESVEADSYVQKGTLLVTIEDTSAVEVKCNLRMDELYWVWNQVSDPSATPESQTPQLDYQIPETPVTVVYGLAGSHYTWQGVLWRYDGIGLDEKTRTVPCRVLVDAPREVRVRTSDGFSRPSSGPPALVRGMFVTLKIHTQPKADLLRVPEVAVQPGNQVWRVRRDRLHTVDVRVIEMIDKVAILRADAEQLQDGDAVVISPLVEVTDGMAVRKWDADVSASPGTQGVALRAEGHGR